MLRRLRRRRNRKRYKGNRRSGFYKPDRPRMVKVSEQIEGLPLCKCGQSVKYAGKHVCEDCFVKMQIRWPGRATRVRTNL